LWSGFVLRTFGSDDEYCRFIADKTDYNVIDVQYRLAPESPFPAAFNDAEDAVAWVRSLPEQFDISCVSLPGFSAGANIASLYPVHPRSSTRKKIQMSFPQSSFYGPVNMALPNHKSLWQINLILSCEKSSHPSPICVTNVSISRG
jgi:acetyl esterase/lipase